jgi:energy-coupling factor transporter ATP-binding protein EcfA2
MIEIKDLNFFYKDKAIIKDLNLNIKKNEFVTICGPTASGKTTLLKLMVGLLKSNNSIKLDNEILNDINLNNVRKKIGVVLKDSFTFDTILEEMQMILNNLGIYNYDYIDELSKLFNVEKLLNKRFEELDEIEKKLISIVMALVHKPEILILDIELNDLNNIIKKLKSLNITIINFTKDLSEAFYSDRLVILNKEILLNGDPKKVLEKEKIIMKIGLEIPFIVDLSIKLKLYGVVDKIYFNKKELVDAIWN